MRAALLAMAVAIAASGCCTVWQTSDGGRNTCYVRTDGWLLLGVVPIVSGDPTRPNRFSPKFFEETTKLDVNIRLLDDEMRRGGFTATRGLSSYKTDENVLFILLKRVAVHTSAEFLR